MTGETSSAPPADRRPLGRAGRIARRAARILLFVAGGALLLVLLLVVALLAGANTGPGRHLIETEARALTGGTVAIAGLGGRFPDRLRAATITVSDRDGPYVTIHDLTLDWHPLALFGGTISVDRLAASAIDVRRLPVPSPPPTPAPAAHKGGFRLPLGLRVASLDVRSLALARPVIGTAERLRLTGRAAIASLAPILGGPSLDALPRGRLSLAVADLDGAGQYALRGDVRPGTIALVLDAHEGEGGLVAALAHSRQISPLDLHLSLSGPTKAERLALALSAGKLAADGHGTVDLADRAADLDIAAHAPAMAPVPGVSWRSLALDAHVHGPFTTPALAGRLAIRGLAAGGATLGALDADLAGDRGRATVHAVITALTVPGPKPDLFAAAPVTLDAAATLSDPSRPVRFTLSAPLLSVAGTARTAGPLAARVTLALPDLAPLAAAAGTALDGHATLALDATAADGTVRATADGRIALTGGLPVAVALLGSGARLHVALSRDAAGAIDLGDLALDGRALTVGASGTRAADGRLDVRARLVLAALDAVSPALAGHLAVALTASGPADDLAATVHASGTVGAHGVAPGAVTLDAAATGLPRAPVIRLSAGGRLDGAPLALAADAARAADGAATLDLTALHWRSLDGHAALSLAPHATLPTGTVVLRMSRLADLSRLAGRPVAGAIGADIALRADEARVDVTARGLAASGVHVGTLSLDGTVRNPAAAPVADLRLRVADAGTAAIGGVAATATARGPTDALATTLDATVPDLKGAPARVTLADTLDLSRKEVTLRRLDAAWHGETVRLAAPATVAYAPTVRIGHLRLVLSPPSGAPATVSLDGTVSPRLALVATASDVTPALAAPFAPTLHATGRIDAEARLTGTTAAPGGTVAVTAAGLHLSTGPAASLAPATLRARAALAGGRARVDASLDAGPDVALRATGTAPVSAKGPIDLHLGGRVNLAVANPVLEQGGRHATGLLTIDAAAAGTVARPVLSGTVALADGDVQDYAQGVHLSAIDASLALDGQSVVIRRFSARAGDGAIRVEGSVGALAPTIPVDIRLLMHDASPVASDLLTAALSADIRATGSVRGGLRVAGHLSIDRADINVPNGLPPTVATLHVVRPGERPPPASAVAPTRPIALDLALDAPGEIFVRGHGLDAVLGGSLRVGGTSAAPRISGGFHLRRGTFSLAGVSLTFTKGEVGFNGTTNGKLDPTIDFVAESIVNQYTADLEVTGYASAPKIRLHSTPPLPQDQVLALILFGTETANLSPLQIAQIAAALASLGGNGGGFDPLAAARDALGLDTLTVGSGSGANGSGASVQGGKYVTRNVYVGARQSTAGGGSQAVVQINLTRHLKAFTTVGSGGTVTGATTPENDPGSQVGLKYQFNY